MEAQSLVQRLLQIPTLRIRNLAGTTDKLAKLIHGGKKNVHFICDFDMTMSVHWVRNKTTFALERNCSSHGIPARYDKLGADFKKETARLYNTYYPIEIDKQMTFEEKVPFMIKWWEQAHEAMISQKLTRQDIIDMVDQSNIELRPGLDTVLNYCRDSKVPFLVFSAGIGDLIERVLLKQRLLFENMHIVSNMMTFDQNDVCVAFKEPLIHVLNKSEVQVENTPYAPLIKDRSNVILIGDSCADTQMAHGIKHDCCLTIGLLNHDIEHLEPRYLQTFDIVIEGDANLNPIMDILENI